MKHTKKCKRTNNIILFQELGSFDIYLMADDEVDVADVVVPIELARWLWKAGVVDEYNILFEHLVEYEFDLSRLRAYYDHHSSPGFPEPAKLAGDLNHE